MKQRTVNILILIVEDDRYMNETLREILEDEGYVIGSAANVLDAINKIKYGNKKYHVLLLDYNLNDKHGLNGLDIFETAKQINPGVKCIMISAYGERLIKEKCLQKGIKKFIDKPFLITDLVDSINNAINNNLVKNNV